MIIFQLCLSALSDLCCVYCYVSFLANKRVHNWCIFAWNFAWCLCFCMLLTGTLFSSPWQHAAVAAVQWLPVPSDVLLILTVCLNISQYTTAFIADCCTVRPIWLDLHLALSCLFGLAVECANARLTMRTGLVSCTELGMNPARGAKIMSGAYVIGLISWAASEGSTVSSLICDRWLMFVGLIDSLGVVLAAMINAWLQPWGRPP